jgi:hypothetical protein
MRERRGLEAAVVETLRVRVLRARHPGGERGGGGQPHLEAGGDVLAGAEAGAAGAATGAAAWALAGAAAGAVDAGAAGA